MPISALPTPPSRQDPANFAARADALLSALPVFVAEANALQEDVNTKQEQAVITAAAVADDRTQTGLDRNAADASKTLAQDWATKTGAEVVAGQGYSAKKYAQDASTQLGLATERATVALAKAVEAAASAAAATTQAAAAEAARAAAVVAQNNAVAMVTGGTGSLPAAPGKLPIAGADGKLDLTWFATLYPTLRFNDIGTPGAMGFGVGICPALPAGYTALTDTTDPASGNYGNYRYSDGSIVVWIPAFYFRLGHAGNPTFTAYGANSIGVKPLSAYPGEASASADGYYLHRAFVNAGLIQPGFFRDKYDCSNNGGIASSLPLAMPLVSAPGVGQVGFNTLTGAPVNAYYGAIKAARTRGAKFFPESIFIADALTRLSEAHAQAATASTYCAWYDATGVKNYPKGNDNNALKSESDLTLSFTSAGASSYPNMALTGSGSTVAKTTHNGQACGVTDVAGNIYKINPGMTCLTAAAIVTGASQANPVQLNIVAHGRTTGDTCKILGVEGMTELNSRYYKVTVVDADRLTLDAVDGTAFAAYTGGGTLTSGIFYTLKPAVDISVIGDGATLATDHWGAPGAAALFDVLTMAFATTYPSNTIGQRYGNGANAVFGMSTANGRALAMLGMPTAGGVSLAGSNAMGLDYFYQDIVNQLCVISRGYWNNGSNAGVRLRNLNNSRTIANNTVGFASASYL